MSMGSGHALALCRIGFGLYFIVQAWAKTNAGWLTSGEVLGRQLFGNPAAQPPTRGAIANSEAFYRPFLEGVVQPNILLIAQLVTIGEWVVGLLLVFGLLTGLGALLGMWLNLHYMLMKGLPAGGGSIDRLFFVSELAFLLGAAGLVWGLDGLLRRQLGGNPATRWLAGVSGRGDERPSAPAAEVSAAPRG